MTELIIIWGSQRSHVPIYEWLWKLLYIRITYLLMFMILQLNISAYSPFPKWLISRYFLPQWGSLCYYKTFQWNKVFKNNWIGQYFNFKSFIYLIQTHHILLNLLLKCFGQSIREGCHSESVFAACLSLCVRLLTRYVNTAIPSTEEKTSTKLSATDSVRGNDPSSDAGTTNDQIVRINYK